MRPYYETREDCGESFLVKVAHDTLAEAIVYANINNVVFIAEIGGAWREFEKCWGCGKWMPCEEINLRGLCESCNPKKCRAYGWPEEASV